MSCSSKEDAEEQSNVQLAYSWKGIPRFNDPKQQSQKRGGRRATPPSHVSYAIPAGDADHNRKFSYLSDTEGESVYNTFTSGELFQYYCQLLITLTCQRLYI